MRGARRPGVRWHFIGTLQSSTAHHVADLADVVETRGGRARDARGSPAAPRGRGRPLDVLIEVDLTGARDRRAPRRSAGARRPSSRRSRGSRLRGLMTLAADPRGRRGRAAVVPPAPRAARRAPREPPRGAGPVDGDVVGLRGRGRGRRYDGPHRNGVVRSANAVTQEEGSDGRRVEEDAELPGARRGRRGVRRRDARGRAGAGPPHAAAGRPRGAGRDRGRRAHDRVAASGAAAHRRDPQVRAQALQRGARGRRPVQGRHRGHHEPAGHRGLDRAASRDFASGSSTGSTARSSWSPTASTCSRRPTSRSRPRTASGSPAAASTTSSEPGGGRRSTRRRFAVRLLAFPPMIAAANPLFA